MATLKNYKGSIDLISGLRAKNNGDFPLMEAHDILVDENGKRLDEQVAETNEALGAYIDDVDALLGNGTGSVGGSSGGLSIKSITFTDRPTAYAWLLNNSTKIIKSVILTNQAPTPIELPLLSTGVSNNEPSYLFQYLIAGSSGSGGGSGITLAVVGVLVANSYVNVNMNPVTLTATVEGDVIVVSEAATTIPDEYWSAMSVQLTCYYIE